MSEPVPAPAQQEAPARVSAAKRSWSSRVWLVLVTVALVALGVVVGVWLLAHPRKDTLWYEVAKTSMQVFGVTVIGGIVTLATSELQRDREAQRKAAAEALERQRRQFKLRATLLDQTSRCAQRMYVPCQVVSRTLRDLRDNPPGDGNNELKVRQAAALVLLDEAYLAFFAEARALEAELGARYSIVRVEGADGSGEVFLRWHQISDLLTVYYFNLHGNFRRDVLKRNSSCETQLHSGLNLQQMVADPVHPTEHELETMRIQIREKFERAIPLLASGILVDPIREL